ncbi:hypothetical protein EG68_12387 [Paragonimus skrjabini miyazakii]|uniref:Uncharacterized protein n=1 Tax=Paragonimus skrjabini miyazakii TaxID=59628 RepID=A0A8S9YH84_9TREM|nr:hypothetical protein EG68_12387 [Paragonimus skrjabini miyazakii]
MKEPSTSFGVRNSLLGAFIRLTCSGTPHARQQPSVTLVYRNNKPVYKTNNNN